MKRSEYTYCYFLTSIALTALLAALSRPVEVRPQGAKHLSCVSYRPWPLLHSIHLPCIYRGALYKDARVCVLASLCSLHISPSSHLCYYKSACKREKRKCPTLTRLRLFAVMVLPSPTSSLLPLHKVHVELQPTSLLSRYENTVS